MRERDPEILPTIHMIKEIIKAQEGKGDLLLAA